MQMFGPRRDTNHTQDSQNTEADFLFFNELPFSL